MGREGMGEDLGHVGKVWFEQQPGHSQGSKISTRCEWYEYGLTDMDKDQVDSYGRCQRESEEFYDFDHDVGLNVCREHWDWLLDGSGCKSGWERNYWMSLARLETMLETGRDG